VFVSQSSHDPYKLVITRTRIMTFVTYAGDTSCIPGPYIRYSNELWRFDTSRRGWEQTITSTVPTGNGRSSHVMTSVGLNLWMHGGKTSGECGSRMFLAVVLLLLLC
jgi:hypothetical protein